MGILSAILLTPAIGALVLALLPGRNPDSLAALASCLPASSFCLPAICSSVMIRMMQVCSSMNISRSIPKSLLVVSCHQYFVFICRPLSSAPHSVIDCNPLLCCWRGFRQNTIETGVINTVQCRIELASIFIS